MIDLTASGPGSRDGRRAARDERQGRGTSGAAPGTTGGRAGALLRAWAIIAVIVALVDGVNVLTLLHDAARQGQTLAAWQPTVWEFTSGAATLVACWVVYFALRRAPPGRGPWAPTLLIHGAASLVFSALHVGLMVALRIVIYAAMGLSYHMASPDLLYEYRKDVLTYLALACIFWLFARPAKAEATLTSAPAAPPAEPPPSASTFNILESGYTLRAPVREILAARSAGNYVEFLLENGRRPLMRAPLREIEAALEPLGFVRTHRSWIVNAHRVGGIAAAGSGDFRIDLHGGAQAPLSRRFPGALERLRADSEKGQSRSVSPAMSEGSSPALRQ